MFGLFFIFGVICTLLLVWLVWKGRKNQQKIHPRRVITAFESRMFQRLKRAFPEYHILAQVAFSALITSQDLKIRNQFNRKVTDFVLLDASLQVIAIVELDDPSHLGKENIDAQRDAMLNEAGYRVFRYTDIPSTRQLQADIQT